MIFVQDGKLESITNAPAAAPKLYELVGNERADDDDAMTRR